MSVPVIGIPCRDAAHPTRNSPMEGCLRSYLSRLKDAGAACVLIPRGLPFCACEKIFGRVDGILFPGGVEDIPPSAYGEEPLEGAVVSPNEAQDALEFFLLRRAVEEKRPFLAICRGIQLFAVALGGTLYQDIGTQKPGCLQHHATDRQGNEVVHTVSVVPGSFLARVLNVSCLGVNSRHHQSVKTPAGGLRVAAYADDGVREAVELPGHPFAVGVQWHPELMDCPESCRLFYSFVEASAHQGGTG